MESIFGCNACVPLMPEIKWRHIAGPLSFRCRRCKTVFVDGDAHIAKDDILTCAWCKKKCRIKRAYMCEWCYDVCACSPECWNSLAPAHARVCEFIGTDISEQLGIDVGEEVGARRSYAGKADVWRFRDARSHSPSGRHGRAPGAEAEAECGEKVAGKYAVWGFRDFHRHSPGGRDESDPGTEAECSEEVGARRSSGSQRTYSKQTRAMRTRGYGKVKISPTKARRVLHDKEVRGRPLTEKQYKFFGYLASTKGATLPKK